MRYVLDTNFIYSLKVTTDSNHKKAVTNFSKLDDNSRFIIPYIVLAELLVDSKSNIDDMLVFCRKFSNTITSHTLDDLNFIKNLPIKKRSTLKANDCLILSIAKRKNAELLTFDKRLLKTYEDLVG